MFVEHVNRSGNFRVNQKHALRVFTGAACGMNILLMCIQQYSFLLPSFTYNFIPEICDSYLLIGLSLLYLSMFLP